MEEENVILSFKGIVTSELLTSVLHIMEAKLESMQENPRTRKKVFNVMVECLQNLYHHVDQGIVPGSLDEIERKSALVLISKEKDHFSVKTGNYIDSKQVADLKAKLETINSLNREDLRLFYQSSLNNSLISTKGTAGLGMIDIARKSGNKLEFDFLKINEETSFFCLNVKID